MGRAARYRYRLLLPINHSPALVCVSQSPGGGVGGGRAGDPDAADSSGLIAFGSVIYWSFLPSTSEELQEHHEHGQPFSWEFRGKKVVIFRGCVDMRYEPQVHL